MFIKIVAKKYELSNTLQTYKFKQKYVLLSKMHDIVHHNKISVLITSKWKRPFEKNEALQGNANEDNYSRY